MSNTSKSIAKPLAIEALSHIVIAVADPQAAARFYTDILGFEIAPGKSWPMAGSADLVLSGRNGWLVLAKQGDAPDLKATGVHQAYSVSKAEREAVAGRLARQGIEVFSYKEDRPAEETDPFYFFDPDGNRVQLTTNTRGGAGPGLDHAAVQVANLIYAEWFYAELLGLPVEHRVGWKTADYVRAQLWADGKEDMAPGTRRLDKRYTVMVNRKVVARPNMHFFVTCGASALGVYLANQHFQEPPEENLIGSPRTGYRVWAAAMEDAAARLRSEDWPHHGPIRHPDGSPLSASLYFKDPGGNYIELATPA